MKSRSYTAEDPKVPASSFAVPSRLIKPPYDPVEESPRSIETDARRLANDDHHRQR